MSLSFLCCLTKDQIASCSKLAGQLGSSCTWALLAYIVLEQPEVQTCQVLQIAAFALYQHRQFDGKLQANLQLCFAFTFCFAFELCGQLAGPALLSFSALDLDVGNMTTQQFRVLHIRPCIL